MTSATIHPRLRARRIDIARGAGRRRLRRLEVVGLVVLAIAAIWAVLRSPVFDLDAVVVDGAVRTTEAEVLAAVGASGTTPLLDVDPDVVRHRLESLPWVATASVERSWPGSLEIDLTERRPVAALAVGPASAARAGWGSTTTPVALVDAQGRVLDYRATAPAGLPAVEGVQPAGVPGSDVDAGDLLTAAAMLPPELAAETDVVTRRLRDLVLVLDDGIVVLIGSADDLGEKLLAAATVVSQVDRLGADEIDVRVPSAPVIRR